MLSSKTLFILSLGLATASPLVEYTKRACGETATLVCYGKNGGQSQDLDPDDIEYTASYL